nr:MAG TPA: hypothetical protein [Caudoviricetes sp.]
MDTPSHRKKPQRITSSVAHFILGSAIINSGS